MKSLKLRLWLNRRRIGKSLIALIFTLGCLLTGQAYVYYIQYVNAPVYHFRSGFSGFGIARNDTINPYMMVVGIGIDPPELWFQYFFTCPTNGTYNFIFIFPFNITRINYISEYMVVNSTPHGSAIWLRHSVENASYNAPVQEISGDFSIENTFQDGTRGLYTIILPFGMGIDPEVFQEPWKILKVSLHSPDAPITLHVGLPGDFRPTNMFPPVTKGPNTWTTAMNRTITSLEWNFAALQDSVTIQGNTDEKFYYDNLPFISGILFGIGVTIIFTIVYDALKYMVHLQEVIDY